MKYFTLFYQSNQSIVMKHLKHEFVRDYSSREFHLIIKSLNVPLIDFVIKKLNTDINRLFKRYTALEWVVWYLNVNPNINNELAYEMFDYLLSIGADIKKRNYDKSDIYYYINQIKDHNIQIKLLQKILLKTGNNKTKEIKIKYHKADESIKTFNDCIELCKEYNIDFDICNLLLEKKVEILKCCIDHV